jgi:ribosomal protein L37E
MKTRSSCLRCGRAARKDRGSSYLRCRSCGFSWGATAAGFLRYWTNDEVAEWLATPPGALAVFGEGEA